jgi:hypothetical protein
LGESRLIDADTKLDAIEIASTKLIGDVDLGGAELAGARRAQRRGVQVDNTELAGGAELGRVFEGGEEACELRRGRGSLWGGWFGWRLHEGTGASGSRGS